MGKYIIDKLKDKRIDIDLGGHWENLMDYIKAEYPSFYTWSDKEKDRWILDSFEFKESRLERANYLDYGYVREFSDGSKGYRLNTTIRNDNDKEDLDYWLQGIAKKTTTALERLYAIFYSAEKFMRERKIARINSADDVIEGLYVSFVIENDVFVVEFVSMFDESCRTVASFTRNSVNEPLVPKVELLDFYNYFSGIIAYTDRAWQEIESSFEERLEELGKD